MLYVVIIASEIAFWSLLAGGLYVRYAHDRTRLSAAMLVAAASTDLVVLLVAGLDLAGGATAQSSHVFAALAVAYSVAYARHLVSIADRFVLRRLGRPVPEQPRASKAARERAGWYRHARMWAVGVPLLGAFYVLAGDGRALAAAAGIWTVILVIDFIVSFAPRPRSAPAACAPERP
jgi:ribose/xylose/arabinose/galactoside ABC-type transport system permease subunit